MLIQKISDEDLMLRFGKLVQTERRITHLVLECISEIDRRKLYLEKSYTSLYSFLVEGFGYSPSAAMRRIESARLLREIPEVAAKIESGSLNLSQLSKMQQAVRTVQKLESRTVSSQEKLDVIALLENTTQEKTEQILAKEFSFLLPVQDKQRIHQDESVTLTITFSPGEMALLEQAKNLMSHELGAPGWAPVIARLAQKEIDRRLKIKPTKTEAKSEAEAKDDRMVGSREKTRRSIAPSLRKKIFLKDKVCQFQDSITGKACGGKSFLQVDHRQPVWAGGDNKPENLRLLCANHNQFKYKKEAGLCEPKSFPTSSH